MDTPHTPPPEAPIACVVTRHGLEPVSTPAELAAALLRVARPSDPAAVRWASGSSATTDVARAGLSRRVA